MLQKTKTFAVYLFLLSLSTSCLNKNVYQEADDKKESIYLYPFKNEVQNVTAEITIQFNSNVDLASLQTEIPHLKYNKSLLFLLTQDDCTHSAYSCTWAAIHGKPLSHKYYYDARHLAAGDLPPDIFSLGKTLGCTDGAGNEVRFAFTTTLNAERENMNKESVVQAGNTKNEDRFRMKSYLIWENVMEMVNYNCGIAFHDVFTKEINHVDSVLKHYQKAQEIIQMKLTGRGCKTLTEPNGNKTYIKAAQNYAAIQTMTAQTESVILQPFKVKNDLHKQVLNRFFYDKTADPIKKAIQKEQALKKEERTAICIGVHETNNDFTNFLLWLNDTYGKDGDDSMWAPNQEEYYEYNYYRTHATIKKEVNHKTLKLIVTLPSEQFFYYPSVTINLKGVKKQYITDITSSNSVTGLTYGDYNEGVMINIDCRRFLPEHATHFVEQYEKNRTESNKKDATYFIHMLKDSDVKKALLKRL